MPQATTAKTFALRQEKLYRYRSILEEGDELLGRLLGYIQTYEAGSKELPSGVHCSEIYRGRNVLYHLESSEGDYTVKHFGHLARARQLYYGWTDTGKARRSYLHALQLQSLEILTPEPIGYIERYDRLGGLTDSYYITRYLEVTGSSLQAQAREGGVEPSLTRDLARFLADLHTSGVVHEDLSPGNLPYIYHPESDSYSFALVDLNRMHFTASALDETTSIGNMDRLFAHPRATEALARAYAVARGWEAEPVVKALHRVCDRFWLKRLPKLALRHAVRYQGVSSATFLRLYGQYLRWRRLRHLCPFAPLRTRLREREQAFYTRFLEPEDVRRALALREGYTHSPIL